MLKLVRMNAGLQTPRDACIQNESCLIYIEGAAVATVVVQAVMLAALGTYVLRDRRWRRYRLLVRWWRPDWQRYREIFRVGTPIGFTIIAETSLFAGSTFLIGTIGVAELAGHAVALQ